MHPFGARLSDQSCVCAWSVLELTVPGRSLLLHTAQTPAQNCLCLMPAQEDAACLHNF